MKIKENKFKQKELTANEIIEGIKKIKINDEGEWHSDYSTIALIKSIYYRDKILANIDLGIYYDCLEKLEEEGLIRKAVCFHFTPEGIKY